MMSEFQSSGVVSIPPLRRRNDIGSKGCFIKQFAVYLSDTLCDENCLLMLLSVFESSNEESIMKWLLGILDLTAVPFCYIDRPFPWQSCTKSDDEANNFLIF